MVTLLCVLAVGASVSALVFWSASRRADRIINDFFGGMDGE